MLLQLLIWQKQTNKQTNKQKCLVGEKHTNTEPMQWETILLLPIWMKKSHSNFHWLENHPLCLTKNKIRKTHSYFHSSWTPPTPTHFFFHQQSKIRLASSLIGDLSFPKTVDLPCFLFHVALSIPSLPGVCCPF